MQKPSTSLPGHRRAAAPDPVPAADEMQAANPRARRLALVGLGVATTVGAILIALVQAYRDTFAAWIAGTGGGAGPDAANDSASRIAVTVAALVVVVTLPLLAGAAYVWRTGSRCLAARRFPPPGTAVIRDTRVLHGADATNRGRAMRALAGVLALTAIGIPAMIARTLRQLLTG